LGLPERNQSAHGSRLEQEEEDNEHKLLRDSKSLSKLLDEYADKVGQMQTIDEDEKFEDEITPAQRHPESGLDDLISPKANDLCMDSETTK
jgi:hypothetical protein